jgi:uncharacterized linocin/CFP29 family protein
MTTSNDVQLSTMDAYLNAGGAIAPEKSKRPHLGVHQNALLRKDEWLEIDTAVLDTVKTGLVGIDDLRSAGLVKQLGGLGTLLSAYEQLGDMNAADVSMDADVPGREDAVEFDAQYVPIPIIHKDFRISQRRLEASRRLGESIDTTQARAATRVVREKIEDMLFNGHSKKLGGYQIYGYTNAPYRITDTGYDFSTVGNGYKTIVKALEAMANKGFQGPFMVYVASAQYGELLNLMNTYQDKNELTVIKQGIPELIDVKRSFNLPNGQMVMVQMSAETVDLAVAQDITPVQWDEMAGALTRFRIMAALAPRIKFDANHACGVLHYTGL